MAFDTWLRRLVPFAIALVAVFMVYLQASGFMALVATSVFRTTTPAAPGDHRAALRANAATAKTRSARAILAHNPFDHATDLNPEPEAEPPDDFGPTSLDLSDPLIAERCDGISLRIVTESTDPTWSVAVMLGPGDTRPAMRRVGDVVGALQVAYIGFNRVKSSPAVWLVENSKLCQAVLFDIDKGKVPPKAPGTPEPPEPNAKPSPAHLPPELAKKIERVSDTEFNIDRAVVDNVLENQGQLMQQTRIVPEKGPDGKTVGIRLFGVRPDTLLGTLGLQNGDRLESINGFNMSSPEDALNAYARLRTAGKLSVKVTRRGNPTTLDFNIK